MVSDLERLALTLVISGAIVSMKMGSDGSDPPYSIETVGLLPVFPASSWKLTMLYESASSSSVDSTTVPVATHVLPSSDSVTEEIDTRVPDIDTSVSPR